jgi:putative endonuclease
MEGFGKNRREKGGYFEKEAAARLADMGYVIKERNYNTRYGEIDIVAELPAEKTLVFIEVKARDVSTNTHPFEFVDRRKQRNIIQAAKDYIVKKEPVKCFIRFDVVGVITSGKEVLKIEVLKDAFQD